MMLVVAGASCRAPRVNSHTGVSTPTNCASDRSVRSFNAQLCSNAMQVTLCWCALHCALNNQHCCFYVEEVAEHWGSFLLHLPTKVEEGNAKWQSRSSLLSTSLLLSARCACVRVFGTNRVCLMAVPSPSYQFLRSLCHFVNIRLLSHFLWNLHNTLCLPLLLLPLYNSDQFKPSFYFCTI